MAILPSFPSCVKMSVMKNRDYYDEFANKIIDAAEPYNIENIAKLYRQLKVKT